MGVITMTGDSLRDTVQSYIKGINDQKLIFWKLVLDFKKNNLGIFANS